MRCFIAIGIPESIRTSLEDMIQSLRNLSDSVRWVSVMNIHLTLKFLGEVGDDRVPDICGALSLVCSSHPHFVISLRGTGIFPSARNPRVLWVGIEESEKLTMLFRDIDGALAQLGFEREGRRFSPHLTLGRVREGRDIESTIKALATFKETFFGSIDITEVLLMKSVLKPSGAEYSKVDVFRLHNVEEVSG